LAISTVLVLGATVGLAACAAAPGQATSPEQAVKSYLTALADGRIDDALSFVHASPVDDRFTAATVVAQAQQLGPISHISASNYYEDDPEGPIIASFMINGKQQEGDFATEQDASGHWFVSNPVVSVDLSWAAPWLGVELNGVPVDADTTPTVDLLIPGGYQFTSSDARLSFDDRVFLALPNQSDLGGSRFTPPALSLTASGATTVAAQINQAMTSCLAEAALTTSCGIKPLTNMAHWTNGQGYAPMSDIDPATITWSTDWTVTADQLYVGLYQGGTMETGTVSGHGQLLVMALTPGQGYAQMDAQTTDGQAVMAWCNFNVTADISDPNHLVLGIETVG